MNPSRTRAPWTPTLSGCARSWRPIRTRRAILLRFTASVIGSCRERANGATFHLLLQFFYVARLLREKLEQLFNADLRLNPAFLAKVHLVICLAMRRRYGRRTEYSGDAGSPRAAGPLGERRTRAQRGDSRIARGTCWG